MVKKYYENLDVPLREIVYGRLTIWACAGKITMPAGRFDYLSKLLGYRDLGSMLCNYNEGTHAKVVGLAGPHGWAVLKTLEARQNA